MLLMNSELCPFSNTRLLELHDLHEQLFVIVSRLIRKVKVKVNGVSGDRTCARVEGDAITYGWWASDKRAHEQSRLARQTLDKRWT